VTPMNEKNTVATTTGGAIGFSAVASFIGLCCIGPRAVALFGVSGAVAMAQWAPVRPYMLALSAVQYALLRTTPAFKPLQSDSH
jgi:hypothetical protein